VDARPVADARAALVRQHFKVVVRNQDSETFPVGQVMFQRPAAGVELKEGRTVALTVSTGPPPREVPTLAGLNRATAEAALRGRGFEPNFQYKNDENATKDIVLDWAPKDGQKHDKGTVVTVVLSNGPELRLVPDLKGKTFADAASALTPLRLTAVQGDAFSDTVPAGQVVSSSPAAGAKVPRDSKVTVNVSKGPELIPLPDMRGKSVQEATAALEGAGFVVDGVQGNPTKPVTNTSPPPGTPVKKGSHVGLYTK
jgi:serine/threonine-protein kinase